MYKSDLFWCIKGEYQDGRGVRKVGRVRISILQELYNGAKGEVKKYITARRQQNKRARFYATGVRYIEEVISAI